MKNLPQHRPMSHNDLKKPFDYECSTGFVTLLHACQTSEDLLRIAYMSEKYGQLAEMEISNRNLMRDYETWKYFQNAKNHRNDKS